ncbi:MAG: hypothetical protein IT269_01165 [Saprospiraceae bacterium]|nr:hypothetical protein [Saprospiraceae bacterium]
MLYRMVLNMISRKSQIMYSALINAPVAYDNKENARLSVWLLEEKVVVKNARTRASVRSKRLANCRGLN